MKIIWVDTVSGSDITGDGFQANPFNSIRRAIQDMESGDQIRILPGTYVETDSVVVSGMDGSLFAEYPGTVYIQPEKTTQHQAGLAILDANRFSLYGLNVLQAADPSGNLIGIYAEDVANCLVYTCAVSDFEIPSGAGHGIFASGLLGRVENCRVSNMACGGGVLYGIRTNGINVIDCEATALSGAGDCELIGIQVGFEEEEDDMAFIELRPGDATWSPLWQAIVQANMILEFANDGNPHTCSWNFHIPRALRNESPLNLRFYCGSLIAAGQAQVDFTLYSGRSSGGGLTLHNITKVFAVTPNVLNAFSYFDLDLSAYKDTSDDIIILTMTRDSSNPADTLADVLHFILARTQDN